MMKYLRFLIVFLFVCVLSHQKVSAQKEIFIKQIEFELAKISDIEYENEYFITLKFNKGSNYIFRITNNVNDSPGDAILEILDADNLLITNVVNDKYYPAVSFQCNKTGFYDLLIRFEENTLGHSIVDVILVQ